MKEKLFISIVIPCRNEERFIVKGLCEPLPLEDNIRKMRTAILADKLVERGHSVLWWTSAFDHFKKGVQPPAPTGAIIQTQS